MNRLASNLLLAAPFLVASAAAQEKLPSNEAIGTFLDICPGLIRDFETALTPLLVKLHSDGWQLGGGEKATKEITYLELWNKKTGSFASLQHWDLGGAVHEQCIVISHASLEIKDAKSMPEYFSTSRGSVLSTGPGRFVGTWLLPDEKPTTILNVTSSQELTTFSLVQSLSSNASEIPQ